MNINKYNKNSHEVRRKVINSYEEKNKNKKKRGEERLKKV